MASAPDDPASKTSSTSLFSKAETVLKEYRDSVRLFSRNAWLYLLGSFIIGLNFAVFQLLFNLYLKELGFVESDIGMVNSYRALGMTLVAIPLAMLLSRTRLKPMLVVGCFGFALFSAGLTTFNQMAFLMGFAALAGMAFAIFRIASGPFYMRNSTSKERTHLFSFSFASHLLASMVGSLGAGNLVTMIGDATGDLVAGYQYTLYIAISISLLALIPFSLIKAARPSPEEDSISITPSQLKRRGRFYFKITFVNFLIGLGAGLVIPFLNLYFRDRFDLPPHKIGFYFILLSLGMLAGTLSGPVFTRRLGLVRTIVITQLASIPFMLILSYSFSLLWVVPAFIMRGGLMNMGVPINNNFAMELAEKREQGLVNALLMVSWTSSWTISVALGGSLIETYGYTTVLNISIVLYVMAALTCYSFFGKVEKRKAGHPGWHIPQDIDL